MDRPTLRPQGLDSEGYDTDDHVNRAIVGNYKGDHSLDREIELLSNLRTACMGDAKAADRLIAFELQAHRGPRTEAIERALVRLQVDRGRYK